MESHFSVYDTHSLLLFLLRVFYFGILLDLGHDSEVVQNVSIYSSPSFPKMTFLHAFFSAILFQLLIRLDMIFISRTKYVEKSLCCIFFLLFKTRSPLSIYYFSKAKREKRTVIVDNK